MDWSKLLLNRTREYSQAEWLALVEAWLLLLFFYIALATGYHRLEDATRAADSAARNKTRAERLHRLVYLAGRLHPIPMTCLVKSLTLRNMLARRGIAAQVQIGARKQAGLLHAHAWVEINHIPIGEPGDVHAQFPPFAFVNLNNRKFT